MSDNKNTSQRQEPEGELPPYNPQILQDEQEILEAERRQFFEERERAFYATATTKQQEEYTAYQNTVQRRKDALGITGESKDKTVESTAVSEEEMTILEALQGEYPMTVTQENLASVTRLSDRTVRKCVKRLREEAGLTDRPLGPKKGEALTAKGLALLSER